MPNMSGVELYPRRSRPDSYLASSCLTAIDEPRTAIECLSSGGTTTSSSRWTWNELELRLQAGLASAAAGDGPAASWKQWTAREVAVRTRDLEERTSVARTSRSTALRGGDWPGASDAIEKLAKELGTSPTT